MDVMQLEPDTTCDDRDESRRLALIELSQAQNRVDNLRAVMPFYLGRLIDSMELRDQEHVRAVAIEESVHDFHLRFKQAKQDLAAIQRRVADLSKGS